MSQIVSGRFVRTPEKFYSLGEEIANCLTHGVAALASVVGLVFLVLYASWYGQARHVTSCVVFGVSLIVLYLASTLYHAIPHLKAKKVLQVVDHAAIFLLIAGSYTPFTLNVLNNWIGITVCVMVWVIAVVGILMQPYLMKKSDWLNTLLYLLQGWLIVVAFKPLIQALPTPGLILLITGGVLYSLGTIFYIWQKLPYHHAIWHLFVLAGSVAHYFAVLFYTLPIDAVG